MGTRIDRLFVADQVSARFTAPLPLKDMTTGSYLYGISVAEEIG
jgi:hypothetical protein